MTETSSEDEDSPDVGLSIDALKPDKDGWAAHADSLSLWELGHVVTGIPLGWMGPADRDPFTGVPGNGTEDAISLASTFDGLICSQTCDLGGVPPGDKHPFVLIAPLVALAGVATPEDRRLASEGRLGYLVPVPRPDLGQDAPNQYADLRMLVPVSKALLVARQPVGGLDGADAVGLSETLAEKFRRPALSDVLSEKLPAHLDKFIKAKGRSQQCFAKTEQVRLVVREGTRLEPKTVQILILTTIELQDDERVMWTQVSEKLSQLFGTDGITAMPLIISTVTALDAKTYRDSVPVRTDLLGHRRWP